MRYLPTINLWDPAVHKALETGQLKLQRGQWVRCGNERPSRFFGISDGGVIYAAHYPRHVEQFQSWCEADSYARQRLDKVRARRRERSSLDPLI